MQNKLPVTAIITFQLQPGFPERWLDSWQELRREALARSTCRQFRLLRNRNNRAQHVVLSEWETAAGFDAFVREAGLIWVVRDVHCTFIPPDYAILEPIAADEETTSDIHVPAGLVTKS